MTPAQQAMALKFLKDIVVEADKESGGNLGYDDHEDTMKIRLFLIKVGAIPDRRKKEKRNAKV